MFQSRNGQVGKSFYGEGNFIFCENSFCSAASQDYVFIKSIIFLSKEVFICDAKHFHNRELCQYNLISHLAAQCISQKYTSSAVATFSWYTLMQFQILTLFPVDLKAINKINNKQCCILNQFHCTISGFFKLTSCILKTQVK